MLNNPWAVAAAAGAVLAGTVLSTAAWSSTPFSDEPAADRGQRCAPTYVSSRDSDLCADASGAVTVNDFTVSGTPLAATDDDNGGISLCSNITLTNNSAEKRDYNVQDFKIQNPLGEVDFPDPLGIDGALQSGSLGPGGTKTGKICDKRRAQKGVYAVIYQPSLFGDGRGVWLSRH